jgi:hypothetical protein
MLRGNRGEGAFVESQAEAAKPGKEDSGRCDSRAVPRRHHLRWRCGPKHSTCCRTRLANGVLSEVVRLSGPDQDMSEEELETFIGGFPIQGAPWLGASGRGGKHAG